MRRVLLCLALGFAGAAAQAAAQDPNLQLDSLAEAFFDETLPLSPVGATSIGDHRFNHLYIPSFAESVQDHGFAIVRRYADRLAALPREGLDESRPAAISDADRPTRSGRLE